MDLTVTVYTSFSGMDAFDKIKIVDFFQKNDSKLNNENLEASISAALKIVPSFGGIIITLSKSEELMASAVINFTGMKPYFPSAFITHVAIQKNQEDQKPLADKLVEVMQGQANEELSMLLKTTHPLYKFFKASSFKEKGRFLGT